MAGEAKIEPAYIADGKARLRPSVVGFLDLLGFSQQVMAANDEQQAQSLLDKIAAAIADSRAFVQQDLAEEFRTRPGGWSVKFFSDNLVLGYAVDANESLGLAAQFIIRCAQRYQLRMILSGLFLRGGLTHGPVCITDEIIFGRALIECYQLESKVSIVPRVIVTPALQVALADFLRSGVGVDSDSGSLLCRDVDGWWFVNYLQGAVHHGRVDWSLIERHRQSILESLATTTRHDVLPKFGWACRYHNMFCHWHSKDPDYRDSFRVTRDDEQSTIIMLSEAVGSAPQA